MVIKSIKYSWILLILNLNFAFAFNEQTSTLVFNELLSPKGTYSLIVKHNQGVTFAIVNTKTKKTIALPQMNQYYFVNDTTLVYQNSSNNQIDVFDIKNNKTKSIANATILKFNLYKGLLVYKNTEDHKIRLAFVSNKGFEKSAFENSDIQTFFISSNGQYLLYQTKNNSLYLIDIETKKKHFITDLNSIISKVYWDNENYFVSLVLESSLKNRQFELINLTDKTAQTVNIEANELELASVLFIGYKKERIVIHYSTQNKIDNVYDNLLEIWSTNDKQLKNKIIPYPEFNYEGKLQVYDLRTKKSTVIALAKGQDIIEIPNENYLLLFNPTVSYDYRYFNRPAEFVLFDVVNISFATIIDQLANYTTLFSYSPNGRYLAYSNLEDKGWIFIDLKTKEKFEMKDFTPTNNKIYWSTDGETAYGIQYNMLITFTLPTHSVEKKVINNQSNDTTIEILNIENFKNSPPKKIQTYQVIHDQKLLLQSTHNNSNSLYSIEYDKINTLINESKNHLSNFKWDNSLDIISFIEENFNIPPYLSVLGVSGKIKTLVQNDTPKEYYRWKKQLIVDYIVDNKPLKGILFYPKNFDASNKYPMITSIYQIQFPLANTYDMLKDNIDGFNLTNFLQNDYFVFYPDIISGESGPAVMAVDCVEIAINTVLEKEKSIDKNKLGLTGKSFGGYLTNFIITQTNLFKAAVSGVGNSDLVRAYYSFSKNYFIPNYFKIETGQFEIPGDFAKYKDLYLENSPILYAHQIETPLLSWTGKKDENVHWGQTEELYVALQRYKKPHIALFYENEGHSILNPIMAKDLNNRILQWFDYYLKDNREIDWIKDATSF